MQSYLSFKIVVVDHGSTDGTGERIATGFPEVILLKGDSRMWWAAATNLGIRYALINGADYVLTLNNDTITMPSYLEELMMSVKDLPENCLIGSCAIDDTTDEIVYCGERINWFLERSYFFKSHLNVEKERHIEVSLFPGRGLLIPASVFDKIGFFDEINFPHYLADYDFTRRAINKGLQVYCSIKAQLKIFPNESAAIELKRKKTFSSYAEHLFGIRGGAQLIIFYKYSFRHCPWYALPGFLFFGTARRIFGYWVN